MYSASQAPQRIVELVDLLVAESERRGFVFITPGCWGFGCRPQKRSDGSLGDDPSVHSYALACDVNAPRNSFGSARSDSEIATKFPWFPKLWQEYGFFWLGPSIGDWMHFHFAGSPADARAMLDKARREFGSQEDEAMFKEWRAGWQAHEDGKPLNPDWTQGKKDGWRDRDKLLTDAKKPT